MLFGLGYAEIIPLPWEGVLRGVCLANHLASTDNLTTSNQETEHIKTQTNVNKESGPNKQQHTQKPMLRQRTDTAWFSAFYDIRPGNGVGLFLQPGACLGRWFSKSSTDILVYGMSNQSEFYCSKRRWSWRWWQPVHMWIIWDDGGDDGDNQYMCESFETMEVTMVTTSICVNHLRRWRWRWWQPVHVWIIWDDGGDDGDNQYMCESFALSPVRLPLPAFNTQPLYGRMPFLLCWFVGWLRGV